MYNKLKRRITTQDPYKKFQRKTIELRILGFAEKHKDIGKFNMEITKRGLEVLNQAEDKRGKFLSEIVELLEPENVQKS